MDAAKAISFRSGFRNGVVLTIEYRQSLSNRFVVQNCAGVKAAPAYKKAVKEYYSLGGVLQFQL